MPEEIQAYSPDDVTLLSMLSVISLEETQAAIEKLFQEFQEMPEEELQVAGDYFKQACEPYYRVLQQIYGD